MRVPNYNARGWWLHASRPELVEFVVAYRGGCWDEVPTSRLRQLAAAAHPLSPERRTLDGPPCDSGLHRMNAGTCTLCGFEDLQPTGRRSPESAAQQDHRLRELFLPALDGGLAALRDAVGAAIPRRAF